MILLLYWFYNKAFQDWVDLKAGWKPALQNEMILCAVAQASCLQY
jgi:hypothetical protein